MDRSARRPDDECGIPKPATVTSSTLSTSSRGGEALLPSDSSRADACFAAITSGRSYDPDRHLFGRRRFLGGRDYEDLWPFANAWSAACTLSSLGGSSPAGSLAASLPDGLAAYHRTHSAALEGSGPVGFESVVVPPLGTGGDVFFDDNAWLALALLGHYANSHDERALSLSRRLLDFLTTGWSTDPSWSAPGGIRWKVPATNTSRNTCSNGPTAEVAALVYQLTGDSAAKDWSLRIYDWARQALGGPDGLYFDRIAVDGTVSKDIWSYNQGTMIGAGVLLHRITAKQTYLDQAVHTATAALAHFDLPTLLRQGPAFNAVFFRNLLLLDRTAPEDAYRELARNYGDQMWIQHRDPHTGHFTDAAQKLNATAPMVQIYALLAGAAPRP